MEVCIFCCWLFLLKQDYLLGSFFPAIHYYLQRVCFLDKIANKFIGVPTEYTYHFGWTHIAIILMIMVASILVIWSVIGLDVKTGPFI